MPGSGAGRMGDLYLAVQVEPHETFVREGDDFHIIVPIGVHEAALGAKIDVPAPDGTARLRVPPGTQTGQRFHIRGRGAPSPRNGERGDLVVEVRIVLPKVLDERSKELLREFGRINDEQSGYRRGVDRAAHASGVERGVGSPRLDMKKTGKAYYMISAVAQKYNIHPQTLRLYEREGLLKPSRTDGNTRLYSEEDLEQLETILTLTRDLGVNLAGVEVILNMRRKIQQMQGEVNEFMEYVKRELARGIDDWEQRLSTAMVKSTSTDLVRVNPPASADQPQRQKNTRAEKTSRYHVACFRRRKTNPSVPSATVPVGNHSRRVRSSASRAATAGATTSTSASSPTRAFRADTITARSTTSSPTTTTRSKTR